LWSLDSVEKQFRMEKKTFEGDKKHRNVW
jgi:hypothetical protein